MDIKVFASSSSGNAYWIDDGITPLLLDCGLPFKKLQIASQFRLSKLGGVLVTHEHKDHSAAVKDLLNFGVPCFMSKGTADAIGVKHPWFIPVTTKSQVTIGSWTVLPFDVQHDCTEPLGFLLASTTGVKLLYATDTYYIKYTFAGLTHIIVECNHSYQILDSNVRDGYLEPKMKDRLIRAHFSLENVKKFLKANDLSKVQEIYLVHLSDDNSDAALFKKEIQAVTGRLVFVAQK